MESRSATPVAVKSKTSLESQHENHSIYKRRNPHTILRLPRQTFHPGNPHRRQAYNGRIHSIRNRLPPPNQTKTRIHQIMKILKLELKQDSTKSDHALAAANIRRELKAAFPTIKFAIRSKSYSGGDSIDIHWELGPASKEVEAITNKYQKGTFNGMIDLYEYDSDRTWTAKHGSAKYVFCKRNCNSAQQAIETQLAKLYN